MSAEHKIGDSYMFDFTGNRPADIDPAVPYGYKVVPAWYEISANSNLKLVADMHDRAMQEIYEMNDGVQEFLNNPTWKNRHHILHELADAVTALTSMVVTLGASPEEMMDVFDEVRLKNKGRRYNIPRWRE